MITLILRRTKKAKKPKKAKKSGLFAGHPGIKKKTTPAPKGAVKKPRRTASPKPATTAA